MKKLLVSVFILFAFISVTQLFSGNYHNGAAAGGDGTITNPYKIADESDIDHLMSTSGDWGSHFIVTQDINCFGFVWDDNGSATDNPQPIGNATTQFTGNFDGQGYTISNIDLIFTIDPNNNDIGFFGFIDGGTVSNLGLDNVEVEGLNRVGSFCGILENGTISYCYSTGNVDGGAHVGGFCGASYIGNINNCYSTGNSTGFLYTGGFCGNIEDCTITNCYSIGIISGTGSKIGGFCASIA